jgi:hypothetical protein
MLALLPATSAVGQPATEPRAPARAEQKPALKLTAASPGAACFDVRSRRAGVFKRDPCGRLYCGDPKLKSILDLRPNYAAEKKCTWQVVSWRCQCVGGASLAKKRSPQRQ